MCDINTVLSRSKTALLTTKTYSHVTLWCLICCLSDVSFPCTFAWIYSFLIRTKKQMKKDSSCYTYCRKQCCIFVCIWINILTFLFGNQEFIWCHVIVWPPFRTLDSFFVQEIKIMWYLQLCIWSWLFSMIWTCTAPHLVLHGFAFLLMIINQMKPL